MRVLCTVSLALVLTLAHGGFALAEVAKDIPLDLPAVAVTVLPDRAEVTRRGSCEAPGGPYSLIFQDFDPTFQADSLRVKVVGESNPLLVAVSFFTVSAPEASSEKVAEIENRTRDLGRQIEDLAATRDVLNQKLSLIIKMGERSRTLLEMQLGVGSGDLSDYSEKVKLYLESEADCRKRIEGLEKDISALRAAQKRANDERNSILNAARHMKTSARIDLDGPAGTVTVELRYFVGDVRWFPSYDLDLETGANATVNVAYKAIVVQRTGVEWKDVDLTLSTTVPSNSIAMAELVPWKIEIADAAPMLTEAEIAQAVRDGRRANESRAHHGGNARQAGAASLASGALAVSFLLPEKQSIAPGEPVQFLVGTFRLDATIANYLVPAEDENVYIRAVTRNTSAYPLLPGGAWCHIDGMFSCATSIDRCDLGAPMKLPFGVEKRLKAKRVEVSDKRDDKGKTIRRELLYKFVIESSADTELDLVIMEALPVSDTDEIKIGGHKFSDSPDERSPEEILTWRLKLGPRAKKEISIEFYVEYPSDWTVIL